ncbi:MAG: polyphenol oxidase family protein [Candidatus Liptonbacteria bacterium]|nr:polyphenol oxidase family protein [Candidatus Liptonbacteria bacterium]
MYQLNGLKKIPELIHGFSETKDGNMSFVWGARDDVLASRKNFFLKIGAEGMNSVTAFLKHRTDIALVDASFGGEDAMEADCLMTNSKNVLLSILSADCLPVIIFDPLKSALALAHLSRINSTRGFLRAIIEKMKKIYGSNAEDVLVGIGPCIHKESYVFAEKEFKKRVPDEKIFDGFVSGLSDGRKAIDLPGYSVEELISAGISGKNVEISEVDTAQNTSFFSHYRSRITGEQEGRMITVAGMV